MALIKTSSLHSPSLVRKSRVNNSLAHGLVDYNIIKWTKSTNYKRQNTYEVHITRVPERTSPTAHLATLRAPGQPEQHTKATLSPFLHNTSDTYIRLLQRQDQRAHRLLTDPQSAWLVQDKSAEEIAQELTWALNLAKYVPEFIPATARTERTKKTVEIISRKINYCRAKGIRVQEVAIPDLYPAERELLDKARLIYSGRYGCGSPQRCGSGTLRRERMNEDWKSLLVEEQDANNKTMIDRVKDPTKVPSEPIGEMSSSSKRHESRRSPTKERARKDKQSLILKRKRDSLDDEFNDSDKVALLKQQRRTLDQRLHKAKDGRRRWEAENAQREMKVAEMKYTLTDLDTDIQDLTKGIAALKAQNRREKRHLAVYPEQQEIWDKEAKLERKELDKIDLEDEIESTTRTLSNHLKTRDECLQRERALRRRVKEVEGHLRNIAKRMRA